MESPVSAESLHSLQVAESLKNNAPSIPEPVERRTPEPGSASLLATGCLGLLTLLRSRLRA